MAMEILSLISSLVAPYSRAFFTCPSRHPAQLKPKEAASIEAIPQNHGAEYMYIYRQSTGDWVYGSNDWTGVTLHVGTMTGEPTWVWQPLTPEACEEVDHA